jgi:plastocyanin
MKNRGLFFSLYIVVMMLVVSLIVLPARTVAAGAPSIVVKMTDKPPVFIPAKVTVKVGQTVQWVNNAKTLHSIDADPTMAQRKQDVVLPPGAKPFDSGFMQPDATFDYTFTVRGTYKYTCVPHEKDGMNGVVVVK